MHYIQKHILDKLRLNQSVNYSELIPDGVESGHFRYHLRQLVNEDLVDQTGRGIYALSQNGQHFVDKLSQGRIRPAIMPKVITYTLLKEGDKLILWRKNKQPFMGLLGMVAGKFHEGEKSSEASIREVLEKSGRSIEAPRLSGIYEVRISKQQLLTHFIAYVFVAEVKSIDFAMPDFAEVQISDLENMDDLAPDFLNIFNRINGSDKIDFADIEINLAD